MRMVSRYAFVVRSIGSWSVPVREAWRAAALAIVLAPVLVETAAAQSFSLDDNPAAPLASPAGFIPGLGAEDEFGLTLPANAGLAPSPSLGPAAASDGTVFSGSPAGLRIAPNGGYIDAFSTNHPFPQDNVALNFSVDRLTSGLAAVKAEFAVAQQMGDIYRSTASFTSPAAFVGLGPGPYAGLLPTAGSATPGGSNTLLIDESALGLTTAAGIVSPGVAAGPVGFGTHDNVDAFDHAVMVPGGAPGSGVFPVSSYFAVAPDEGVAVGVSAADIFDVAALAPGTAPVPFAAALSMGLDILGPNTDSIDALVMFDNGLVGGPNNNGPGAEAGIDFALFSLSPGSATLASLGLSADDVFFTDFSGAFATYALATDLGLFAGPGGAAFEGNNIDALELDIVPEPGSIVLAALALGALAACGWRRRR